MLIYRNGVSWAIFGPQQPLCFDFRPNSSHLVSSDHKIIFQKNLSLPKKWLLRNCNEIMILLKSGQVLFSVSEHYTPFSRVAESDDCPSFPSTELGSCLHLNNFISKLIKSCFPKRVNLVMNYTLLFLLLHLSIWFTNEWTLSQFKESACERWWTDSHI